MPYNIRFLGGWRDSFETQRRTSYITGRTCSATGKNNDRRRVIQWLKHAKQNGKFNLFYIYKERKKGKINISIMIFFKVAWNYGYFLFTIIT